MSDQKYPLDVVLSELWSALTDLSDAVSRSMQGIEQQALISVKRSLDGAHEGIFQMRLARLVGKSEERPLDANAELRKQDGWL